MVAFAALLGRLRQENQANQREARKQTVWFLCGTLTLFIGLLLNFSVRALPPELAPELAGTLNLELVRPFALNLILLVLPLCIGVAHYRYGLFGGEVVVEHTLTHLTLAAILVGVYVLLVRLLGSFAVPYGSSLVIVVSAASLALLLQPLAKLIRRWVDRVLYGERTDPYGVLLSLSGRLELSGHPEDALAEIGRTLEETFKLVAGGMDLQFQGQRQAVYRWGTENAGDAWAGKRQFSLVSDGETVGVLWVVSLREQFSQEELDLLREVSRHTGRVMQSLKLRLELQRSREQRVETFEAELKRLRNDLHDGIAPSLVGLARHIDVVLDPNEEEEAKRERLENVQKGLFESVRELRQIIYGLRPPALDELGLLGALQEYVSRLPQLVQLELSEYLPISAATEVALFRIATEALGNVQKHARANKVWVQLNVTAHLIELSIEDDGKGFALGKLGIGIRSMRERAEELGGKLLIFSRTDPSQPSVFDPQNSNSMEHEARGTVVRVSIPLHPLRP